MSLLSSVAAAASDGTSAAPEPEAAAGVFLAAANEGESLSGLAAASAGMPDFLWRCFWRNLTSSRAILRINRKKRLLAHLRIKTPPGREKNRTSVGSRRGVRRLRRRRSFFSS